MKKHFPSRNPFLTASLPLACLTAFGIVQSAQAAAISWDASGGGGANTAWNYNAGTFVNWSDNATPAGDDVTFTATGAVSGATTVSSTLDANYNINSLVIKATGANYHNFDLNGKTLTVAGAMSIGDATNTATNVTMKSGTLTAGSAATNFIMGGDNNVGPSTYNHILDLSGLTSFNLTAATAAIGSGVVADSRYANGTLTLSSTTNVLTLTTLAVAYNTIDKRNSTGILNLSGTTTLKADTIGVGGGYNTAGSGSKIVFAAGGGSVNIRNKAGTGAVGNVIIGDRDYEGTSTSATGTMDFSLGTVNAQIATLRIGENVGHTSRTGTATGTLIMGSAGDTTSIIDVTTANFAIDPTGTFVGTSNVTLDIRGGTFRFDTMNVGADRTNFNSNVSLLLKGGTFAAINGTANTVSNLATLQIGGVGGVTFGQISGGTGGLTLNSAAITLGASTTQTVNVATTLSGTISATANTMEKLGAGTLTLSGTASNLNTGLVTVSAGTLELNKTAGFNAIGGNLTVSGGTAKLLLANQLADASTVTLSSGSFNTNNLTETVGTFNMSDGSLDGTTGTLTAATYALTGGTVNAKLGTGAITVNTGTVALGSAGRLNPASTLSVQGGQLTLAGAESVAGYTQTGGTLAGSGHTLTSAATYNMQAGAVSANLGGSGIGLNKTTAGTVTLSGTNSYTGATTVSDGVLRITHGNSLGATGAAARTNIAGNESTGRVELSGGISTGETFEIAMRQLTALDAPALSNFSGNNTITGDINGVTGGSRVNIESQAGLLTLAGSLSQTSGTSSRTWHFMGAGNGLVSGVISNGTADNLGIIKSGAGIWTMSNDNTYTGNTSVNQGTLVIDGDNSGATGNVTVNNADTRLKGTGTIGGDSTINTGAIHSVGNSVGTQTFHDGTSTNLTYAEGSIFEWELGATLKDSDTSGVRGTDWDAVNVSGTLGTTGAGAIFRVVLDGSTTFVDAFWLQDREWTDIFKTSEAGTAVNFASIFSGFQHYNYSGVDGALVELGDVSALGSFSITGSTLNWTAVPEPTSALAGILLGAGLLRRRRARA